MTITDIHKSVVSVAGTVVLYNPGSTVINNILSYIDFIDILYVIDNSEAPHGVLTKLLKKYHNKIRYISMGNNQGVAKALNKAASFAIKDGYDWLLTMDQDSAFNGNILPKMFQCLDQYNKETIGIISSRHTKKDSYVEIQGDLYNEMLISITSGSMINLGVHKKVGPFMEKLFIDHVDHEYCLRLKTKGYKIIQVNNALIRHKIGEKTKHLIFQTTNHNAFRRYFMIRNRFYVANMYIKDFPIFYFMEMLKFTEELLCILLFEKQKYRKLKNIVLGYWDYKKNRFDRSLSDL